MLHKAMRMSLVAAVASVGLALPSGCFSPAHPRQPQEQAVETEAPDDNAPPDNTPSQATPTQAPAQAPAPTVFVAEPSREPAPAPRPINDTLRQQALRVLLDAADSNDPRLRANAIESLRDAVPQEAVAPALTGLSDPDPLVRFAATMAVGALRIQQAHAQLLQMHDSHDVTMVQVGIRFALHRLGDTRFSHDLEKFARDPSADIRGKTALALGLLGEPSAVLVLRPMRHDAESAVRLQVAESLWRLGDEQGLVDLTSYAISKYPDDLILATLALAAPKDDRVTQHVRANLTSDYPEVNLAAARALGMLGSDEGYPVAMKGAHSQDPRQRSLAALALGAIGRSDAQPVLAELLKDPNASVRISAAMAMLQLKQGE